MAVAAGTGGSFPSKPDAAPPAEKSKWLDTELKRGITPAMLTLFVIGDVIGGGIYALVGTIAGQTGGAMWAPFAMAFVLALLTAGSYAELISKYPRAGGAAYFIKRAYKSPALAFITGVAVLASGLTSAAALATAFGGNYFQTLLEAPQLAVSLTFIGLVAIVNFRGVTESVRLNMLFTAIEVIGLLLIVFLATKIIGTGGGDPGRALDFNSGDTVFALVLSGAALAFYAFVGFEDTANMAEEVKDPGKAYPKALFAGLLIAGAIYMLVTVTASMALPTNLLSGSDGPLLEVVRAEGNVSIELFAVIGLFAVANGALINMMMASRLLYGMSSANLVPGVFGLVHSGRRTPWVAILFTTALAAALIWSGSVADLAATTSLLLLCVFILVNGAVMLLRRDEVEHHHFRVPVIIPAIGIGVCIALLTQQDSDTFVRAGILLAVGGGLWLLNLLWDRSRASRASS